jgi:hypothetical protein
MTKRDVQAELQRFHRDVEYYQAHQAELLAKYPEHWVAIYNERVVGADPDFDRLLQTLEEREVPAGEAFVEWVTEKDDILILPG